VLNMGLPPGNYAQLTVKDNGKGMGRKIKERIFDPYFTTKEKGKGTGLGLSVVHGIIKKLGGAISVYTEPGEGTSFHLFFPLVDGALATRAEEPGEVLFGDEKIMFVDDEADLVEVVVDMLEALGYEVAGFNNVVEALDVFKRDPDKFDLVITDKTMPKMTGFDFAAKLVELRSELPVILCTGFSEPVDLDKIEKTGIKSVIMKPMVMRDLSDKIRKVLDG